MALEQGAVASVTLTRGSVLSDARQADLFDAYGYSRSNANPHLWLFQSQDVRDQGAAIRVLNGGQGFALYSMSQKNAANLNYLASRAGWHACDLLCADPDVEHMVRVCFAHVDLDSVQVVDGLMLPMEVTAANDPCATAAGWAALVAQARRSSEGLHRLAGELCVLRSEVEQLERALALKRAQA